MLTKFDDNLIYNEIQGLDFDGLVCRSYTRYFTLVTDNPKNLYKTAENCAPVGQSLLSMVALFSVACILSKLHNVGRSSDWESTR